MFGLTSAGGAERDAKAKKPGTREWANAQADRRRTQAAAARNAKKGWRDLANSMFRES
jgi:hypothetical protein